MYTTIEQGLAVYDQEFYQLLDLAKQLKREHGQLDSAEIHSLPSEVQRQLQKREDRLKAMEEVLGIFNGEAKVYRARLKSERTAHS